MFVTVTVPVSLYMSVCVCWQVSEIKFVMSCRHGKGFLSAIYFISALLYIFLFFIFISSFASFSFGIFLWCTLTHIHTHIHTQIQNYKDLQCPTGKLQFHALSYDMFISVCVSFLMIFNYARDSRFVFHAHHKT